MRGVLALTPTSNRSLLLRIDSETRLADVNGSPTPTTIERSVVVKSVLGTVKDLVIAFSLISNDITV